jgi:hypothetical protein
MTDQALIEFERAGRYMCSPEANMGNPPRGNFVPQLDKFAVDLSCRPPEATMNTYRAALLSLASFCTLSSSLMTAPPFITN